jgi:hypothetical protein
MGFSSSGCTRRWHESHRPTGCIDGTEGIGQNAAQFFATNNHSASAALLALSLFFLIKYVNHKP